jgi:two-component system, NtrC family, sensor kinase
VLGEDWPTDPVNKQLFADSLQREGILKINYTAGDLKSPQFKLGELDSSSLLIINLSKDDLNTLSEQVDFNLLSTPVVLKINQPDLDIVDWVNNRGINHFVQDENPDIFSRIVDLSKVKIQRRAVVKQIADQSKSADQVVQDQEEKIIAKTLDIELSNQEQNQKLKRERQLLKFLKDLALADFYESFLRSIKNEFKVFHALGEIFLVEIKSDIDLSVLNLKVSDRWKEHKVPQGFENPLQDFVQGKNLSVFFANVLQRPFGKVVSMNLKGNYFLIVEHHLSDLQNVPFQEFFGDRQDVLKMVFDKIDNEEKMNSISFRWEKIFDFIKDPIAIIDEDYNVVAYNRAFEAKPEQSKCYQVFAGANQPCLGCPMEENKRAAHAHSGSIIVYDQNFDVMAFDLGSVDQKRRFVHTYKDQTESNRLQLELIQKKKMATIGKLAGHLSHELNNPLTGIRSMAQILLKETTAESQAHRDLTEIESAAQRSLSVIRNFIEFSDDKNTRIQATDIHGLIERTIPLMKTSLRNHSLFMNLGAKKYTAHVNAPLFQQVLFNLIKNATQAMTEKGKITIETTSPDSTTLKITVADSGKGIPKALHNLIFQPFFTTKEKTQGNGLGLSIVKSIVESFRGKIYFTSEEGAGTRFHIELPVASRDENLSH